MRYTIAFFACLLLLAAPVVAQKNITGVWRGYFYSGAGFYKQRYKYEIQIQQLSNKSLKGVTYSYRTTVFYGKATLQGIFTPKTKSIVIKENKLVEVKIGDQSEPCLMTCYLDYAKAGKLETLQGSFMSINLNSKGDCGSGTVYLEKVPESDFHKEDFLVKKSTPKPNLPSAKLKSTLTNTGKSIPKTNELAKNQNQKKIQPSTIQPSIPKKEGIIAIIPSPDKKIEITDPKKIIQIPKGIRERENSLVKTLLTNSPEIKIELYDNGQIDNDTVTIYHNNQVIAYKKKLSHQPITINLHASAEEDIHEFIMVADNLGEIPPNTALMIITTGGKRYEVALVSTEQKNAKVVVKYQSPG